MTTLALDAAALESLVAAAVAAPSIHNSQPWRFRLRPESSVLEVRAARERALPETDPAGRALHISVGAAVLNLRVAARHLGWAPEVRLLPDPSDPDLLAGVRLDTPAAVRLPGGEALYEAIWHRHSIRTPFTGEPVPPAVLDELVVAARAEDALLELPGREETNRILQLTSEAERRNTTERGQRAESRNWVHGGDLLPYGIPTRALGPQDRDARLPMRDFTALRPVGHGVSATFEAEPRIAVLVTGRDERADWLRAGLALEHVLLAATVHGVRASLLHQAMEWPYLRWATREPHHGPGHVQMLIRLGYGPEGAPVPRLAVRDVLETAAEEPPPIRGGRS
ncbi:aromatic ring-opening dioxygenase LigA [Streptomyces sp. NRRL S-495]|uniref:Acg family FMN-binding oxidoreductase n=1 Tax=Streptomyces sp. NRRL S-495 TaxID=1609133 RepID=UPI0005F920DF|nr:aromatic ring-opening dioxygenase LigA [Streptomyces sp. NRRL S-495]KJY26992.1 aromatic ring-opening dioxygenase LigA [Streptomyces sp. NRRL S-495]